MSFAPLSARADPVSTALERAASTLAAAIVDVAAANPVVLIDGRSGSGKTSLARRLVAQWPLRGRVQLVALDSLYPGWDGLAAGTQAARDLILRPHARGLIAVWERWDWESSTYAESHAVDPSLPLIVEGSGLLTAETARLGDVRVWLESPPASRKHRALERDGDLYRSKWAMWAAQEEVHLSEDGPAGLATVVFAVP